MTTPRQHAGDSTSEGGASEETASEDGASKDGAPKDDACGEWRLASRVLVPCQAQAVKAARDHVARLVLASGFTKVVWAELA